MKKFLILVSLLIGLSVAAYSVTTEVKKLNWNSAFNAFQVLMYGDSSKMIPAFSRGTWNPTLSGVTNITGLGTIDARYSRIGDKVFWEMRLSGTMTSNAALSSFTFTVPPGMGTTGNSDWFYGTGSVWAGSAKDVARVDDNSSGDNNTVYVAWVNNLGASQAATIQAHGVYTIR